MSGVKCSESKLANDRLATGGRPIDIHHETVLAPPVQPEFKLKGDAVGSTVPNGIFYFNRPPGNHEISMSTEVESKPSMAL